jgi:hypothetical protein
MTDVSDTPICQRCHRPVIQSRDQYDVFEQMHRVCFHYEFEHGDVDPDRACEDPSCPSRMIDKDPPLDWFADRGIER